MPKVLVVRFCSCCYRELAQVTKKQLYYHQVRNITMIHDDDHAQLCHARDRLPCSLCSGVFYTEQLLHFHILKLHSN